MNPKNGALFYSSTPSGIEPYTCLKYKGML